MRELPPIPWLEELSSERAALDVSLKPFNPAGDFIKVQSVSPTLAVEWQPTEPWLPRICARYATRDFRKGYPMTWDLEVPMRVNARPLFLRPGVKRAEPPVLGWPLRTVVGGPSVELLTSKVYPAQNSVKPKNLSSDKPTEGAQRSLKKTQASVESSFDGLKASQHPPLSRPSPGADAMPAPSTPAAPKGSRMKGWAKANTWHDEDPWKDTR